MLVSGDLVFGEDQARLCAPYLHIGIGCFGSNGNASSRMEGFGCLSLGGSSLSSFLQTAEQIRFPTRDESEIVVVLSAAIAGEVRGETARHTFSRLVECGRRSVKVSGWHAPSSCSLGSGTRLLYSRHSSGQVEILVQRPFHDPGQLRITKASPPLIEEGCWKRAGTSFDGGRVVKRLQIHCRATIFWPHGTTREGCG